jgi:hypothetical protein
MPEELKRCFMVFRKLKNHPNFSEFEQIVSFSKGEDINVARIEASLRDGTS